jgi:hypothetical protein
MPRLIALLVALLLGAAIAWAGQQPPKVPAEAPATAFSAQRAMRDVAAISRAPHPIGSAENARVRTVLLQRMAELGLETQARPGLGARNFARNGATRVSAGQVVNLVGVLPGRDRAAPAVVLMAHYDSVPNSPGAADDAAGVAAALEVVRALRVRGGAERDVMVLLTDGEEAGLLGANAFFRRDPLARRVGFVINMEARGSAGRVQMFQTSPQNAGPVRLFAKAAARPSANSLSDVIYQRMPNDTDFTEVIEAGRQGLNFAFIGGQFDYHAPTATPANLNQGTLQDLGEQVLEVASAAAASTELPRKGPDLVYGELFGGLVAYPPALGWLVLGVAAALVLVAVLRARRAAGLDPLEALQGAGAALYLVLASAAVLHFARLATGAGYGWYGQRPLLAHAERWEAALMVLAMGMLLFTAAELARGRRLMAVLVPGVAALGACLASAKLDLAALIPGLAAAGLALLVFVRPVSRPAGWGGVLAVGLLLGVAAQSLAPAAAHLVHWPLLGAGAAAAATSLGARRGYASLALLALAAAITVGWLGATAHLMFLGLDLPQVLAAPLLLASFALWPLAQPAEGAPSARALGPALIVAAAVAVIMIRLQPPWDARRPEATSIVYHLDQDTGRAWLASLTGRGAWSDEALRAAGGGVGKQQLWALGGEVTAAPARSLAAPAPNIQVLAPAPAARLRIEPAANARALTLRLKPQGAVRLLTLNGVAVDAPLSPGEWNYVQWHGGGPVDLRFARSPGLMEVRYTLQASGFPPGAAALPPRPTHAMPMDLSGSTLISGTRRLTW